MNCALQMRTENIIPRSTISIKSFFSPIRHVGLQLIAAAAAAAAAVVVVVCRQLGMTDHATSWGLH